MWTPVYWVKAADDGSVDWMPQMITVRGSALRVVNSGLIPG
jgi:hypothetical protein